MNILIITDVIHAGGAETFVLRLAKALHERGHKIIVYPLYKNKVDLSVVNAIAPNVAIRPAKLFGIRLIQMFDGLLIRLGVDFSLINYFLIKDLRAFSIKEKINVIHSNLFTADMVAIKAGQSASIPVVTTIHGDYSAHERAIQRNELKRILHFREKMAYIFRHVKSIICISEEHIRFFKEREKEYNLKLPFIKIYNGYKRPETKVEKDVLRASLNIPQSAFVYCMVARGIPEKGWAEVINAFQKIDNNDVYLLLIGHSDYVDKLKKQFNCQRIKFLGQQEQPFHYLNIADVGLFCSKIKTEALPTVIIEYLAAGLPVISTNVGECKRMLATANGIAGIVISGDKPQMDEELLNSMRKVHNDKKLYETLKSETAYAFQKFDMQVCVAAYERVYKDVVGSM